MSPNKALDMEIPNIQINLVIFLPFLKINIQWTTALSAPDLTAFRIQQPGYLGPKFLQAFTMLIFPDLTTPDLTAKPDLQALFFCPIEKLSPI